MTVYYLGPIFLIIIAVALILSVIKFKKKK